MSIHRYATRQDGNHRAIVNALKAGGAVVYGYPGWRDE